jgi:hypothetical protein
MRLRGGPGSCSQEVGIFGRPRRGPESLVLPSKGLLQGAAVLLAPGLGCLLHGPSSPSMDSLHFHVL